VLAFCSGVEDINNLCSIFEKYLNPRVFKVFALHGKIAISQQKEVFYETKEYKIIFASRIAETSITINGVKVVIDPGVDRELVYDQRYRVSSRRLVNISQSSAKQRAGRAGRTSKGYCFRLYTQNELNKFRINKTP
jgi:ATP-dependent RNA helicase DHX8/PRP22